MIKLRDVSEIITKGTTPTTIGEKFVEAGVNYVKSESITRTKYLDNTLFEHITEETHRKLKRSQLEEDDLLFSIAGAYLGKIGKVRKEDLPLNTNQAVGIVRLKKNLVDVDYVYYYFSQEKVKHYINILSSQSGQPNLNLELLGNLEFVNRDLSEQKKIGMLLSILDEKIENNNKINEELESMAKTIYDYWFLQFEFPNEEGKPYQSSGGKMVWNEELKREIPEGWRVWKVKDCISHINTGLNPRNNFVLGNGTIKYITVKNLTPDGKLNFFDCDTIDEKAREIVHRRSDISKGDILFASIAPLGRCFLIQEEPVNWDINESVFSIRPDYRNMTSEYLYMFFMSPYFIKKAEHNSIGSVFNGIRISTLENMLIAIPPKRIMNQFNDQIKNILYAKNHNEQESTELTSMRDFLLPLLMNGQVGFKV